jgi:hypothetical protein
MEEVVSESDILTTTLFLTMVTHIITTTIPISEVHTTGDMILSTTADGTHR